MPRKRLDFDDVRKIAMTLPDVEDSTIHGAPSLKVRGRLLTCPALHRSPESNTLAVRIGFDTRAELLAAEPDVYYVTSLSELSDGARAIVSDPQGRVTGSIRHGVGIREREAQEERRERWEARALADKAWLTLACVLNKTLEREPR